MNDPSEVSARVEQMYLAHHQMLRDYLYGMTRNRHLSDDICSETFERALRHLLRTDGPALESPAAWLKAVARNLLTDHYRRAANRHEIASANIAEGMEDSRSADQAVLAAEALTEVCQMMEGLTPGQRTVVVLRALHDMTTSETAEYMGRTPQAVRSLRHKALRYLNSARDAVEDADDDV